MNEGFKEPSKKLACSEKITDAVDESINAAIAYAVNVKGPSIIRVCLEFSTDFRIDAWMDEFDEDLKPILNANKISIVRLRFDHSAGEGVIDIGKYDDRALARAVADRAVYLVSVKSNTAQT